MTAYICDWTEYQGSVLPAAKVEAEGFAMVKLKAGGSGSKGRYYEDPRFLESASALLSTRMVPGAYWYLSPGRSAAQAGLFYDLLVATNAFGAWVPFIDVESWGINDIDFVDFCIAWQRLAPGKKLVTYTNKSFWQSRMNGLRGVALTRVLEEAHWVDESVRANSATSYASQQVKAIDPNWWGSQFGGWSGPSIIQFTDRALVAGARTCASVYRGSKAELQGLFA